MKTLLRKICFYKNLVNLPWRIHRVDILTHVEPDSDLGNVAGVDGIMEGAGHGDTGPPLPSLTLTCSQGGWVKTKEEKKAARGG